VRPAPTGPELSGAGAEARSESDSLEAAEPGSAPGSLSPSGSTASRESVSACESVWVGEVEICGDEILREAQYHPAPSFEQACDEARRSLVIRALLIAEATRLGLISEVEARDERAQQAAIGQLMDHELPVPDISLDACERFYSERPERFRGAELYSASHILILAQPDDPESHVQARAHATEIRGQLTEAPERFEALARKHSGCPSARSDGALGQIEPGESPAAFDAALRRLRVGEIAAEPIETEHGFHILRLDARAPGQALPFEAVRDKIRIYLRDRAWRSSLRQYIEGLAQSTRIRGFELR